MGEYKYPDKLVDYITEQAAEGNEIFTTSSEDGVLWIIPQRELDKWVVVCEWYEGQDDFQLINITGKGFDRLLRIMKEMVE